MNALAAGLARRREVERLDEAVARARAQRLAAPRSCGRRGAARSAPPARWRRARSPARRAACGAAPAAARPAARTGRPACGRCRHRRDSEMPQGTPCARAKAICSRSAAWPASRSTLPCGSSSTSVGHQVLEHRARPGAQPGVGARRRRTAGPARPSGAPARRPWRWPAGWSGATPTPAGRRSRRRAAARRRGSRCGTGGACGGTGSRSRPAQASCSAALRPGRCRRRAARRAAVCAASALRLHGRARPSAGVARWSARHQRSSSRCCGAISRACARGQQRLRSRASCEAAQAQRCAAAPASKRRARPAPGRPAPPRAGGR